MSHGSAIPSSLVYAPSANGASATNHEATLSPVNGSSFEGGQVIRFDYPAGKKGQYLNPQQSYLSFTYTPYTAGGAAGDATALPSGGASSLFESLTVYSGSNRLSHLTNYGAVRRMFKDLQTNRSDQTGAISVMEGIDPADDRQGEGLAAGASIKLCMPLMNELIGAQAKCYFPLGLLTNLRLELELTDNLNGFVDPAASNNVTYRLTDLQLRCQMVELSDQAEAIVAAQSGGSTRTWSTCSWSVYNDAVPQHAGPTTIRSTIPARFSSVKSIYSFLTPVAARNDSANQHTCRTKQAMTEYFYDLNSKRYPQRPVDSSSLAMVMSEVQKALHSLGAVNTHSSINAPDFGIDDGVNHRPQFLTAVELENFSHRADAVFSGISTLAQAPAMEFTCQAAQACQLYHVVAYDIVVQIADGTCSIMS